MKIRYFCLQFIPSSSECFANVINTEFVLSFYKHLFISKFLESINFRLNLFTHLLTHSRWNEDRDWSIHFQRCLWQKEDLLTNEFTTLERISPHCAESVACATYVTQRIFVISSLSPNVPYRGGGGGDGRCSGFRGGRHQYHGSPAVRWKVTKLSCSILCLLILNLATKW